MKDGLKKIISCNIAAAVLASLVTVPTVSAAKPQRQSPDLTDYDADKTYNITVLPDELQTVTGWGVAVEADTQLDGGITPKTWLPAPYSALVNDSGMTIFRIGLPHVNYTKENGINEKWLSSFVDTTIKPLYESGLDDYTISIWSHPEWMHYRDERRWNQFRDECTDEAIDWIINVLNFITERGYPAPSMFSIQNEPMDPSANIKPEQLKALVLKLREALDENGYEDVKIGAPEGASIWQTFGSIGDNFSMWEENPDYSDAVGAFVYHSYPQNYDNLDVLKNFKECLNRYPDKEIWQTELSLLLGETWYTENEIMDASLIMLKVFVSDMAWIGCNKWLFWYGSEGVGGKAYENGNLSAYAGWRRYLASLLTWGEGDDTGTSFRKIPLYNILRYVWKNAPVGSKVHRMATDDPTVQNELDYFADLVAFDAPNGTVAVILNSDKYPKHYNLHNLKGKCAAIHSIDASAYYKTNTVYRNITDGDAIDITIPALSATAIVCSQEDVAAPHVNVGLDSLIFKKDGVYYSRNGEIDFGGMVDEDDARVYINGRQVEVKDNKFTEKIDIVKEPHITMYAVDKLGNRSENYEYDFACVPEYVGIELNKYAAETNSTRVTLSGKANTYSEIFVNSDSAKTDAENSFKIDLNLEQGNNSFKIYAQDSDGNKSEEQEITIYCDSTAPKIDVTNTDFETDNPQFMVKGKVDETASLTVNGKAAELRDDLTFASTVLLNEGVNTVKITAEDALGNIRESAVNITYNKDGSTPHLVKGRAAARRANGYINLDGKLDEADWKIDLAMAKIVEGNNNNVVKFGLLWDSNNLYIGVDVKDDSFKIESDAPYSNDCVEIFINASNEKKGAYVNGDKQIFSGFVKNDMSTYYYNKVAAIKSSWRRNNDGYTCEIAVPWTAIGKTPTEGLEIGFDLAVDDNDIGGSSRCSVTTWWGKSDNYADTSGFGTIVLSGTGDVVYEDIPYDYFERTDDATEEEQEPEETAMKLLINGKEISGDLAVMKVGGKIMVPIDRVAEGIGASVSWEIGRQLVLKLPNGNVSYFYDTLNDAQINGVRVTLEEPPSKMINDKIYADADFVAKILNGAVEIDGDKSVNINGTY